MELVRESVPAIKTDLGGIGQLEVQAERRVARGGAMLRTQAGEIDGRLETQLERARETLIEALSESAEDAR
jgi:flagellar assembly protein FliH